MVPWWCQPAFWAFLAVFSFSVMVPTDILSAFSAMLSSSVTVPLPASWSCSMGLSICLSSFPSPITCMRSTHELWHHISYEIAAWIVALHLAGYMHPLPIGCTYPNSKMYFFDSRPRWTRYGSLGLLTPEPLIVNDPIPPLHLTPKQLSVCLFFVTPETTFQHLYILTPLHCPQNTPPSISFTPPSTPPPHSIPENSNLYPLSHAHLSLFDGDALLSCTIT